MTFTSPSWVSALTYAPRDAETVEDFLQDAFKQVELDQGRCPLLTCAIDFLAISHAVHRLGGVVCLLSTTATVSELAAQLQLANVKALFASADLESRALEAAQKVGLASDLIFLIGNRAASSSHLPIRNVDQLANLGSTSPVMSPEKLRKGQGKSLPAYICFSAGTSGHRKAVLLSHCGIIANVMQICALERYSSVKKRKVALCVLPFAHSYGLICVAYNTLCQGDEIIILPDFQVASVLNAIEKYQVNLLYFVPTMMERLLNDDALRQHDLSSVESVCIGGSPLDKSLHIRIRRAWPCSGWKVKQCYVTTEAGTAIAITNDNVWMGSGGFVLPHVQAKIFRPDGSEIYEYDEVGELFISSPSLALGYLANEDATKNTFIADEEGVRWLRTGDAVMFCLSAEGHEYLSIIDRMKDSIIVKDLQLALAELEDHLATHDFVEDVAVIGRKDSNGAEWLQVFVVKSTKAITASEQLVTESIHAHIRSQKARPKWLQTRIIFLDYIPRTNDGKKMRRALRNRLFRFGHGPAARL
ncbi:phenylacetyl- ligase [Colletotrichum incanum]|uniref:Phenylacetyl-ligase n=1 Tax=Colletotrichum incanum TaxID=1573173 RepID=A0A167D191_COLIC|nr:phenylacetyl- ligase [Colletotrichum incanum]